MRRRLVQNLVLAGAATLIALLAAEGVLRLSPGLLPDEAQVRLHWSELRNDSTVSVGDPYLGFRYPPSFDGRVDRGRTDFTYRTDEHGFRNPSPWPDSAAVVIVGDSQAFGYGVEDDEAWPRLLERRTDWGAVVNLGLIGAAPQQYTRILERLGRDLSPRVVLYCLFPGNDIRDALLFDRWEAAGSEGNYDVWRFFGGRGPGRSAGVPQRLAEGSYLFELLRSFGRAAGARFAGRTIVLDDGTAMRLAPALYEFAAGRARPDHPDFERVVQAIERARSLTEAAGNAFVVVLVPTKEEVYLPAFGERTPQLVGPFAAELERRAIDHLDPTPAFQRRARAGEALFFEVDGHPNAAGNRLMAEVVASYLEDHATRLGLHPDP